MLFKELCNLNMSWVYRVGFLTEPQFSKHTNIFQNCPLQAIKYLHYRVNNVCLVRNDEIFTVFLKILYGFFPLPQPFFLKSANRQLPELWEQLRSICKGVGYSKAVSEEK